MDQHFVVLFSGSDRPGIVEQLTSIIVKHKGNWEESRSARLSGEFAGVARVRVPTLQAEALRSALTAMSDADLNVHVKLASRGTDSVGASIHLSCTGADHEGIVNRVAAELAGHGINVEEMETFVEAAPVTGIPLFRMECQLRLPSHFTRDMLSAQLQVISEEELVDFTLSE